MKKKFTLLIVLVAALHTQSSQAQQGTVSSGGDATGSGGSAAYSAGQVTYTTITGTGGTATGGIQQPYEIFVLGKDDFESIRLSVIVYPNPTVSKINLSFESLWDANTRFELFDLNGKLLKQQKVTLTETQIDMEHLPSAMYFLKVYAGNKTVKNFKILKRD